MSEQDGRQAFTFQCPITNDPAQWNAYWKAQGQQWRTEPEIDAKRQDYLTQQRSIPPSIEQGVYPFKDIDPKLTRADIEWLLSNHDGGKGPVDWDNPTDRSRVGLDLRGADLREMDLTDLPLARTLGWIEQVPGTIIPRNQREMARIHLEGANLSGAHLEGTNLTRAYLEGSSFVRANLRYTSFYHAHVEIVDLRFSHMEHANFEGARMNGVDLRGCRAEGANFRGVLFDRNVRLKDIVLSNKYESFFIADTSWENANLSVVDWTQISMLGDEVEARKSISNGLIKPRKIRIQEYETAVRANRQLALALRSQGLNENADYFAYRSLKLQRNVLRLRNNIGPFVGSLGLDIIAGYGYKPIRSLMLYVLTVILFAILYYCLGVASNHSLAWNESIVVSLTAFHGRGFFTSAFQPGDPQAAVAAIEAIVGLLIEITFIATFTQRFFAR